MDGQHERWHRTSKFLWPIFYVSTYIIIREKKCLVLSNQRQRQKKIEPKL